MDHLAPTDNFFIRHATNVAIATVTVLMSIAAIIFWQQAEVGNKAKNWVKHTYEVRSHIRLLSNRLKDAEIGQMEYLATGKEEFLKSYSDTLRDGPTGADGKIANDMRNSIDQELIMIEELTHDNQSQVSILKDLKVLVEQFKENLSKNIAERKAGKFTPEQLQLTISDNKILTKQISSLIRIMESEETYLLGLRDKNDELQTQQNQYLTLAGLLLAYLAIISLVWIYQRHRAKAQAELMHYTRELEKREEELQMQQEELKASNEEIEAFNEELEEKTESLEEQNAQIQQQAEELEENQMIIEEKAREVERASRYKSEFLANMSHELRTPLNSLLILAKILASNEEGNLTEEQVEEANVIHNGGLELLGLINDILDLSKIEAGKLEANTGKVEIDNIIKHMQQQFSPVAKDKSVAFKVDTSNTYPQTFYTDMQRVEQILKNLLSNAFKFTSTGSVTLAINCPLPHTHPALPLDDVERIVFSVTDTGIGIDTAKFADIFEAFQQEDGSIDRRYGGTGLGLTIARKFAHMLGGDIHVSSEKGKGSCFTLVLPLTLAHVEAVQQPEEIVYTNEKPRVELKSMPRSWTQEFIPDDRKNLTAKDKVLLIIEDDATFANILMKMARKNGYKCLCAGDGKSGLLFASEEQITAIILDMKLPDINGIHVLEQLKNNLKTRHIPVHIISGYDQSGQLLLTKGAIGYLSKPAEPDDISKIFNKIEEMISSNVKRILVVEDDQKNQMAIQNLLKKKDLEIVIVGNGKDGLEHINKSHFDCIILDLQLPDMSGFEWLESLHKMALPPVIIYTARELTEDENRRLNHYTNSIIIKGARSPERLLDEVTLFLHSVESTLPKDQQDIMRMQHNPNSALKDRTVLLVDDDLRNTFALSKLLKAHGINIIIADNGQMALDKLNENKDIELVIMDIMMPVMDGYQAMRAIRKDPAVQNLPIIALTARAMPDEQEKCISAGANDYLTKPLDIERLLILLRVWLFRQEKAA